MQALSRTALSCAVVLALSTTIDAHARTLAPASAATPAADGTTATGAILGQVLDPATGQYLRNARIKIDGREVALSGDRGQFRITGLAAGEQRLQVEFTGFATVEKQVTVQAGQTSELLVELFSTAS